MHTCWTRNEESAKLCWDLFEKAVGKDRYYEATELVQIMNNIQENMRARNCFRSCFQHFFLYVSTMENRMDLLDLLLSGKCYKSISSANCRLLSMTVYTGLIDGALQSLLLADSSLTSINAGLLHDVVSEDLRVAIQRAYRNNEMKAFKLLISFDKDLNKDR